MYPTPQELPGALRFVPSTIDLGSRTGIFTGVRGTVAATLRIPAGHHLDGDVDVELRTPLSRTPVPATHARTVGRTLIVTFDKADLDNNVPDGDAVPLTLSATLLNGGKQKQVTSTATVRVVK